LQVGAQAGDEGVEAAAQAAVHLGVGGRSRQQQAEHQGEGGLGVGPVQPPRQVHHQGQAVEGPGLAHTHSGGIFPTVHKRIMCNKHFRHEA